MSGPLDGVRIVALEQYGAGPWGSVHLADLGAQVIKIEDPSQGGDVGRTVPPYAEDGDSLFFQTFNRNKQTIDLDVTTDAGRKVLHDLVRVSDAVWSNLRGDVPEKLGITYDQLQDVNPRIVCCSLSGYGMTGPRAKDPGYDYLLQGLAGWMSVTGEPGGPPTKTGLSLVDFAGGFVGAMALLAGVIGARSTGRGMDCDVSLFDTAISMLNYLGTWHLNEGFEPQRVPQSGHPSLVPFGNVRAKDGWLVIACPKEKFWVRLCEAIGRPELAADPRFADFESRRQRRDEVMAIVEEALSTRTVDQWLPILREAGVPSGPINDVPAALRDEHTAARGMVIEFEHESRGTVRSIASPVRAGEPRSDHRRAPRPGEDAGAILDGLLGYDATTVAELRRSGAFGGGA